MTQLKKTGAWIDHTGDKMPDCFDGDELAEVLLRNGVQYLRPAADWNWNRGDDGGNLTKYRTEASNTRVYPAKNSRPSLAAYEEVARLYAYTVSNIANTAKNVRNRQAEADASWHDHARLIETYEPERLISKRERIAREMLCHIGIHTIDIYTKPLVEKLKELGIGDD